MQEALFRRRVLNSARNSVLEMDERFGRVADALGDDLRGGRAILIATADHGTDLWEHGSFGHGRSSFWNAKFRIPFVLTLGGDSIPDARRTPALASQLDLWPTLFDALAATPRPDPRHYSDGVSLLNADRAAMEERPLLLAGRFYPWADRPSALVSGERKYWFTTRRSDTEALVFDVIRTTDLDDRPALPDRTASAAFDTLRAGYWKFVRLRPRADSGPAGR
jgi:arylsulfatase A-like enzyme